MPQACKVSFDEPLTFHFLRPRIMHQFTRDMKNILVLSMLVSFVMICSCQRKDSAAEQQFAQRKVELDAREQALDERMNALNERVNALDERVKALAEKEKATANARTSPTDTQGQIPNPAQEQAERDSLVQQFSNSVPDQSQLKAEKAERTRSSQEQLGQSQSAQEEKLRAIESKWHAAGTSSGAVYPAPAATLPIPSPAEEATLPSPSPSPE
jgi:hypothetical protein